MSRHALHETAGPAIEAHTVPPIEGVVRWLRQQPGIETAEASSAGVASEGTAVVSNLYTVPALSEALQEPAGESQQQLTHIVTTPEGTYGISRVGSFGLIVELADRERPARAVALMVPGDQEENVLRATEHGRLVAATGLWLSKEGQLVVQHAGEGRAEVLSAATGTSEGAVQLPPEVWAVPFDRIANLANQRLELAA